MTYELAKQLKDAGFTQKKLEEYEDYNLTIKVPTGESVYVPSLSELIEACGDDIVIIKRYLVGGWCASNQYEPEEYISKCEHDTYQTPDWKRYEGPTPEEAVAKLWLELNRKKVIT